MGAHLQTGGARRTCGFAEVLDCTQGVRVSVAEQPPAVRHGLLVKRHRFARFALVVVQHCEVVDTVLGTCSGINDLAQRSKQHRNPIKNGSVLVKRTIGRRRY